MDIHKPKPWHGVREFLKEYVIIVVGVLTALAAESGVEWLHWRHLAEQHDADLRSGAQTIAANALQRMAIDECATGQLQRMAEALRQPGPQWKGLHPEASGAIRDYLPQTLVVPTRAWPHAAWESAVADGSLTHLSPEKLRAYTIMYSSAEAATDHQRKLFELMPELTPLAFDQTLSPQDKARYLAIVGHIDGLDRLMVSISRTALTVAANEDFWPPARLSAQVLGGPLLRRGACAHAPDRSAFQPGGEFYQPMALQHARGN